ncbi:MAG: non-canonical purine pyrophosphatase, rdgB/HAM1 family [Anaerocolumna sp.]|jgi:XTP/dITP diphosphohydrolase|nr:non-canonical purine pyrophosphatase, rdgB/HAM1 family [Anaerocolumna sp.]
MKDIIIFATNNEGKMKEIKKILSDLDYDVISMKEAGIIIDIVEDGNTYEENAIIKAKTIMEMTGKLVLADDSGLEVDAMDKAPGIYSARFLGENTSYDIKNNYIIDQLKNITGEARSARFVCAIACAFPNGEIKTTRGTIEGYIGDKIAGENGFGYDPIFMIPQFGCTSAELTPEMKNQVSHRGMALDKMKEILRGNK